MSDGDDVDIWRQRFAELDAQESGFVTLSQTLALKEKLAAESGSRDAFDAKEERERLRGLLHMVDDEHLLDFKEFLVAFVGAEKADEFHSDSSSSSMESTEELHQIFDSIDQDCDGFITLEEMVEMEKHMTEARGSVFNESAKRLELRDFLRAGDLNNDHRLDFREFVLSMKMRSLGSTYRFSDSDDEVSRPVSSVLGGGNAAATSVRGSPVMHVRQRSASGATARRGSRGYVVGDVTARHRRNRASHKRRRARVQEAAEWETVRSAQVDPSNVLTQHRLRQLFLKLDREHKNAVNTQDVLELAQTIVKTRDPSADHTTTLRAVHEALDNEQSVGGRLTFEAFANSLTHLKLTVEELKEEADAAVYDQAQQKQLDLTQLSVDDVRDSLESVSRRVGAITGGDEDDEAAGGSGASAPGGGKQNSSPRRAAGNASVESGDYKVVFDQMMMYKRMAEQLMIKCEAANEEVLVLEDQIEETEEELSEAQRKLAHARASKPARGQLGEAAPAGYGMGDDGPGEGGMDGTGVTGLNSKRTHAERNQEFFFLTTLACKLNMEARYKAAKAKMPAVPPTKRLYDAAMKARVPFQFYAKWIERQIDPKVRKVMASKQRALKKAALIVELKKKKKQNQRQLEQASG